MQEINNPEEWQKYLLENNYQGGDNDEPEKYPCLVKSVYTSDGNGCYEFYIHYFVYQQKTRCPHCTHTIETFSDLSDFE
jgi:hypothetical protein